MKARQQAIAEGILFTDMYQLTMAHVYFRVGLHERPSQFDHFFRSYPDYGLHKAGYCIAAGLDWLLDWMEAARFTAEDRDFLQAQTGGTGEPLFQADFLDWLQTNGNFEALTLRAIPEGRVVHPHVPLTTVQGPLALAQILETPLLNKLNYTTLIATKAARVNQAGRGRPLLEFGMRRGHERGVTAGARAALIGGADFTSNVGASAALNFPPKGTHAHSMVQLFMALGEGELGAFEAFADVYPDDCLLLVDTVDSLNSGLPNAIKVFEKLRQKGHKPVGIRLDSGDLAYLAVQAARMLDKAGFPDTVIVLSNQLDELSILQILAQIQDEAASYGLDADDVINRLVYGVGTSLIISAGDSALGGVYKLVAAEKNGDWVPAIKISESAAKTPNPGYKRVWRVYDERGLATADLIGLDDENPAEQEPLLLHHPLEHGVYRRLAQSQISNIEPLHMTAWEEGTRHYHAPPIPDLRAICQADLERLDIGVRRLLNPHIYHVSLTEKLWNLKQSLIESIKNNSG